MKRWNTETKSDALRWHIGLVSEAILTCSKSLKWQGVAEPFGKLKEQLD